MTNKEKPPAVGFSSLNINQVHHPLQIQLTVRREILIFSGLVEWQALPWEREREGQGHEEA